MKSSLNKGLFLLLLTFKPLGAEPIQLIPKTPGSQPVVSSQLPPLEATGFWEGTPPSLIETYLSKIPIRLTSRTLRKLRADLLKEKYAPLLKNLSYETMVYSLLTETGLFTEAKDFLVESNLGEKDSRLINIQWMEGEPKKACDKIANLIRTSPSPEWKKQNIYCLYLNGEGERGKVAAELLRESNPNDFILMNALFDASLKVPLESSITASPFSLSVWASSGQELSEASLNSLSPSGLSIIARSDKMPFKTRLFAALKAYEEGFMNAETLDNLLKASPSDDLLVSLKEAKNDKLIPLLEKAHQDHKLGLYLAILKAKIEPSQETLGLAPLMIRAYLQAGDKDMAQKWSTLFMREAPDEAIGLLPLLHLAFPQTKWGESQLQAWQAYQSRMHPQQAAERSYEVREILTALGETPGPAMKGEPTKYSWRTEKGLFDEKALDLLESAALSKRKGEVLLLTLILTGDWPLKDISAYKFVRLLGALHKGGFATEARELALEYLLSKEL